MKLPARLARYRLPLLYLGAMLALAPVYSIFANYTTYDPNGFVADPWTEWFILTPSAFIVLTVLLAGAFLPTWMLIRRMPGELRRTTLQVFVLSNLLLLLGLVFTRIDFMESHDEFAGLDILLTVPLAVILTPLASLARGIYVRHKSTRQ